MEASSPACIRINIHLMMIFLRMTQITLHAAIYLKIVAILIERAAIVVIDGIKTVVVIKEGVVIYEAHMLPD